MHVLSEQLDFEFKRYIEFSESNQWWSAVLSLSSIFNCINVYTFPQKVKHKWLGQLFEIDIGDDVVRTIGESFVNKYNQMARVLSVGEVFNDDELLLVVSNRSPGYFYYPILMVVG